ncbi:MAG: hypothetical protein ACRDI2_24835, partial [Chloroflexota bacterium]
MADDQTVTTGASTDGAATKATSGTNGPVRGRAKLRDVAAAAAVSVSVASRALGGYPEVAAATR